MGQVSIAGAIFNLDFRGNLERAGEHVGRPSRP